MKPVVLMAGISALITALSIQMGCGRNDVKRYTIADHDRLFLEGSDLISPYMRLHGVPPRDTKTSSAQADLKQGISTMEEVIKLNPVNWPAYWTMGKAYQALEDHASACNAFAKAFEINDDQVSVAREYTNECMHLGRTKDAIHAAKHAVHLNPNDAGL